MKFLALPAALALLFCSCKEEAKPQAATAEHHDHDGHDHGGHDHGAHDHGGHDEGVLLGSVDLGGIKVEVEGPAKLPSSGSFHAHVNVTAGATDGVLRIWHGDEKASNTAKTSGKLTAGDQHLDIEAPKPAQAGDAIWIEVEATGKPAQRASIGGKATAASATAPAAVAPAAKPASTEAAGETENGLTLSKNP